MGNNQAFSSFQASVLACYNHGVLTKELLCDLMEPYRDTDIDQGGMAGTLSKTDKLDVIEIVIKTWGLPLPQRPKLPKDWRKWTPEQSDANDKYNDEKGNAFRSIKQQFDW